MVRLMAPPVCSPSIRILLRQKILAEGDVVVLADVHGGARFEERGTAGYLHPDSSLDRPEFVCCSKE